MPWPSTVTDIGADEPRVWVLGVAGDAGSNTRLVPVTTDVREVLMVVPTPEGFVWIWIGASRRPIFVGVKVTGRMQS